MTLRDTTPVAGRPCYWCDRPMTKKSNKSGSSPLPTHATKDHIVPRCRGGGNRNGNRVWACLRCNNLKGNMMPDDWMAWMAVNPEKVAW